jgi:hypothetical protein
VVYRVRYPAHLYHVPGANRRGNALSRGQRGGIDVTATTYVGEAQQLAIAQQALDKHVVSSTTGLCLACRVPGPCLRRETAAVIFARFERLPRRVPGLSRRELVGARGSTSAAVWFGCGDSAANDRSTLED